MSLNLETYEYNFNFENLDFKTPNSYNCTLNQVVQPGSEIPAKEEEKCQHTNKF